MYAMPCRPRVKARKVVRDQGHAAATLPAAIATPEPIVAQPYSASVERKLIEDGVCVTADASEVCGGADSLLCRAAAQLHLKKRLHGGVDTRWRKRFTTQYSSNNNNGAVQG